MVNLHSKLKYICHILELLYCMDSVLIQSFMVTIYRKEQLQDTTCMRNMHGKIWYESYFVVHFRDVIFQVFA